MRTQAPALMLIGMLTLGAAGVARGQDATLPPTTPPANPPAQPDAAAPAQEEKLVYYRMTTSMGDIILELNGDKAPVSTKNFGVYAEKGFYDGTIFHRVIDGFMIQGGGFAPDMAEKKTEPAIKNEWQNGLKNKRGTIAMARRGDRVPNPKTVDSATAQFYINVVNNDGLDRAQADGGAYAVFGRVSAGMDVVDKIKAVRTASKGGHENVPVEPVLIKKVAKITKEDADKAAAGGSTGG